MNGATKHENSPVADMNYFQLGERPHHRAVSLSSVASSSLAPTSVFGELSVSDPDSEDGDFQESPKKSNEADRYGFTGGDQYTDPNYKMLSVEKIRMREIKWLSMLNNWEKWMSGRFSQVKNRCRKGIPPSLRGRAWQLLSGGKTFCEQNQGKYEAFLAMEADPNCVDDIEKDLHRQFPFHEMFVEKGGSGQQDLRDVLRAYTIYNPRDGYCQAQAPIAAVLLMLMPAEQAFWCMVAMFEHYLQGYFSHGLEAIQIDGYVMQSLLRKVAPVAHKQLEKNQVTPVLYMTEWFMCVFSRTLPWTSVLRLWDMFFCEGIKIIFRCGLVLLRCALGTSEQVKKLPGLYETMEALRKIDPVFMREDRLMFEIVNLKISERDLEHEHKLQKIKWKKDKSSGPPISNAGKEAKRVYRYTPTYRPTDTRKHRAKTKKGINSISVNSLAIIEQASGVKGHVKRKADKGKKQKKDNGAEEHPSHSGKSDKVEKTRNDGKENPSHSGKTKKGEKTGGSGVPKSGTNDASRLAENEQLVIPQNRRNLNPTQTPPRQRSLSGEPVVTTFSKAALMPNTERSLSPSFDTKTPTNEFCIPAPDIRNSRDRLTVF